MVDVWIDFALMFDRLLNEFRFALSSDFVLNVLIIFWNLFGPSCLSVGQIVS